MWQNLPIVIRRRSRQKSGYGFESIKKSERGFDIRSARDYQVGDPPRAISRKHLARLGKMIVLEKHPDRSIVALFLIDISASEQVGSERSKHEAQLALARGLASSCLSKNCAVIILAFASKIEFESNLIRSTSQLSEAINELGALRPKGKTDPRDALNRAFAIATRPTYSADIVFLLSDLLFENPCENEIAGVYDVADFVAFVVQDATEKNMPVIPGAFVMRDAETGAVVHTSALSDYDPLAALRKLGIDFCTLDTSESEENYYLKLLDFFEARKEES